MSGRPPPSAAVAPAGPSHPHPDGARHTDTKETMSAEQQPTGQDVTDADVTVEEVAKVIASMGAAAGVASNPDLDESLRGLGEHAINKMADKYNT